MAQDDHVNFNDFVLDGDWDSLHSGPSPSDHVSQSEGTWQMPGLEPFPDFPMSQPMVHTTSLPVPQHTDPTFGDAHDFNVLIHSAPADERTFDELMLQHWHDAGFHSTLHSGPASWAEHSHVSANTDFPLMATDMFHDSNMLLSPVNGFSNQSSFSAGYDPAHKPESVLSSLSMESFDTAPEATVMDHDSQQEPSVLAEETESTQAIEIPIHLYEHNQNTGALVAQPTATGKRPRGRSGKLSPASAKNAAKMRKIGACESCRKRKAKCDEGIFCRACISYHRERLSFSPFLCRNVLLTQLTSALLTGHVFPKNRPLTRYLSSFSIDKSREVTVHLSLGFGVPFTCKAWVIIPHNPENLFHQHVVYPWPPGASAGEAEKRLERHWVYPVVLTDTAQARLEQLLDKQLDVLLHDPNNFKDFPLWHSDLKVLKEIYIYYCQLPEELARPLRDALKLLIAVHVGGDTKVEQTCQCTMSWIVQKFSPFYSSPPSSPHSPSHQHSHPAITPCFVRGQLGPAFNSLANGYMRNVLLKLQNLSLSKDCKNFPIIMATFAVFWMTVESIQYHAAKMNFHAKWDSDPDSIYHPSLSDGASEKTEADELNIPSLEYLLKFYQDSMGGCHAQLWNAPQSFKKFATTANGDKNVTESSQQFLTSVNGALVRASKYLETKRGEVPTDAFGGQCKEKGKSKRDMTCFFDRRLAKFFLPVLV